MSIAHELRKGWAWAVSLAVLLSCAMIVGCGRKSEQGEAITAREGGTMGTDYQALWQKIDRLQEQIRTEPSNVELRHGLVETAVDSAARVVWAAGRGLVPPDARSRAIGLQAAQRAATVDAYRWLAFLLRWRQDYHAPDFGSLEGTVPGAVTVHCDTSGNEVRVLVQAPLP